MRSRIAITGATRDGVLVLLGLMLGCQYDPYTSRYATRRPDVADLVGTWRPTRETLHDLATGPYRTLSPRIEIRPDGSIQMKDLPDTWRDPFGNGKGEKVDFVGRWKLERDQDQWWGFELLEDNHYYGGILMVLGNRPPQRLVLRYGDPDEGNGYEFENERPGR